MGNLSKYVLGGALGAGALFLAAAPASSAVGDPATATLTAATVQRFDFGLDRFATPLPNQSCSGTELDDRATGDTYRVEFPATCFEDFLVDSVTDGGGYGSLPEPVDVITSVTVGNSDVRLPTQLTDRAISTELFGSAGNGEAYLFRSATSNCTSLVLEVLPNGTTSRGLDLSCTSASSEGGSGIGCDDVGPIECFAPEFRFNSEEQYFPMDPQDFVEGSELIWYDGCFNRSVPNPNSFSLGTGNYVALRSQSVPQFNRSFDFLCETDGAEFASNQLTRPFQADSPNLLLSGSQLERLPSLPDTQGFALRWRNSDGQIPGGLNNTPVGSRVQAPMFTQIFDDPDGPDGQRIIAYHVFFGFDPKSISAPEGSDNNLFAFLDGFLLDHEGDWERVLVVIDDADELVEVRYEGHGCQAGWPSETVGFDTYEDTHHVSAEDFTVNGTLTFRPGTGVTVDDTHPVVFVAQGSHAMFPFQRDPGPGTGIETCREPGARIGSGSTDISTSLPGDPVWRPWEDGTIRDPALECWYGFGGAWGDRAEGRFVVAGVQTSGNTGPLGPPFHINGLPPEAPFPICLENGQPVLIPLAQLFIPSVVSPGQEILGTIENLSPSTGFRTSYNSVETPLGEIFTDENGVLEVSVTLPDFIPPGLHTFLVRDTATGAVIHSQEFVVEVDPACFAGSLPDPDVDGDLLIDSCDENSDDGPLADADFDLIPNHEDNCTLVPNRDQERFGRSSVGLACDEDFGHNPTDVVVPPSEYPQPPETESDSFTVEAGSSTEFDVLSNDGADASASSVRIEDAPASGTATVNGSGEIVYEASDGEGVYEFSYSTCTTLDRCAISDVTVTVVTGDDPGEAPGSLPPCSSLAVDSFGAGPWFFTFQIRNTTSGPLDFEFVIPDANYQLTNLVFNGSSQNVTLDQTQDADGTYVITVAGTLPAFQSVGGQQPNGFEGALNPTNGTPETNCAPPGTENGGSSGGGDPGSLPPCSSLAVDSFGAGPWFFTFQIRNTTSGPLDFEFVIPDANYQLTNLVFNGSGQDVTLDQTQNPDGTYDITVAGTLPAFQSVGGQQPNGFQGSLNPTNGTPQTNCEGI